MEIHSSNVTKRGKARYNKWQTFLETNTHNRAGLNLSDFVTFWKIMLS